MVIVSALFPGVAGGGVGDKSKVAVQIFVASIVTVSGFVVLAQFPVHPVKTDPVEGVAVKVILLPVG